MSSENTLNQDAPVGGATESSPVSVETTSPEENVIKETRKRIKHWKMRTMQMSDAVENDNQVHRWPMICCIMIYFFWSVPDLVSMC